MAKIIPALALGATLFACSAGARAQTAATPVPDMKPDLSAMSFLVGSWSCHSHVRGSSRPNTTTYSMDLDGRWIKGHDTAPPFDKYRDRTITTDSWTTYNPVEKKWVATSVDNFGGYFVSTSPGWHGNLLTSTAIVTPDGSTGSDTLTKDSDAKTTDVASGKDKDGKPTPTVTTVCMKS